MHLTFCRQVKRNIGSIKSKIPILVFLFITNNCQTFLLVMQPSKDYRSLRPLHV
jgi:hypothetical protein